MFIIADCQRLSVLQYDCGDIGCLYSHARQRAASHRVGPAFELLSIEQRGQVDEFIDELMDWNTRMNITGEANRPAGAPTHVVRCQASFHRKQKPG
eukprot:scaffold48818_cov34-Prasinocladus_malaysianus.AAC.1